MEIFLILSYNYYPEAKWLFWMAWAETSDKLKRANTDLWRMQRVEQLSSKMLKVGDFLIYQFEDQFQM